MDETLYETLGVDADADEAAIRAAYRAAAKEHHPDVSDDAGAKERFKRITTARDVLLDPTERERYDDIGHRAYVEQHLETAGRSGTRSPTGDPNDGGVAGDGSAGGGGTAGGSGSSPGGGSAGGGRAPRSEGRGPEESGSGPTPGSGRHRVQSGRRRHVRSDATEAAGGGSTRGDGGRGRASATYERSAAASRAAAAKSEGRSLRGLLAGIGPWLLVHVLFLASAVATAVFTLTEANAYIHLSLPAYVLGLVLFALVVALSVLHLVSEVVA
jgi:curved DNA-binding protein CbpA